MDGYIVADETNMFYFTGFDGAARLVVPTNSDSVLYVYGTNYEAAKASAKNCSVQRMERGVDADKNVAEQLTRLKLKKIGFDSLDVSSYLTLKKNLKKPQLKDASQMVYEMRKVKDETELRNMLKAA